jgi:hypothetical protein
MAGWRIRNIRSKKQDLNQIHLGNRKNIRGETTIYLMNTEKGKIINKLASYNKKDLYNYVELGATWETTSFAATR